jgi:hypothetical protein
MSFRPSKRKNRGAKAAFPNFPSPDEDVKKQGEQPKELVW